MRRRGAHAARTPNQPSPDHRPPPHTHDMHTWLVPISRIMAACAHASVRAHTRTHAHVRAHTRSRVHAHTHPGVHTAHTCTQVAADDLSGAEARMQHVPDVIKPASIVPQDRLAATLSEQERAGERVHITSTYFRVVPWPKGWGSDGDAVTAV